MNKEKALKQIAVHRGPGVVSSVDSEGNPNVALFGSVRVLDADHLAMALGGCRTERNLRETGKAVYLFYSEGASLLAWQGARLYLEVVRFEEEGALLESLVKETEAEAGRMAAGMLRCAVVFRISAVRPLIDLAP